MTKKKNAIALQIVTEETEVLTIAQDLQDIPENVTPETEQPAMSFESLQKEFYELKKDYLKLADELHKEKFGKKSLHVDFAEMQRIIQRKSTLFAHIEKFESILKDLESIGDISQSGELFENSKYYISIMKKDYREEAVLRTSNTAVLGEFIEFMKSKIRAKLESLKEEIENLELV